MPPELFSEDGDRDVENDENKGEDAPPPTAGWATANREDREAGEQRTHQKHNRPKRPKFSAAVDVWACGVVLFLLIQVRSVACGLRTTGTTQNARPRRGAEGSACAEAGETEKLQDGN